MNRTYLTFESLLTADEIDRLIKIVYARAPYRPYGQRPEPEGFGKGIAHRYDVARNFVFSRVRDGIDPSTLLSRTNFFRETFAYEAPLFPEIGFFQALPKFVDAAREVTGKAIVQPGLVYINLLVPGQELATHTDVPEYRGALRTHMPEWLLVAMYQSGLFERWRRQTATGIAWYSDCRGGEFRFYPNGPRAPARRIPIRPNIAIMLDADSTFHGIEQLAPGDRREPVIDQETTLHRESNGRWSVQRGGDVLADYAWEELRLSITWKARCFADEKELRLNEEHRDDLTLDRILETFADDLRARGKIAARPDDDAFAYLLIDEYCHFPPEPPVWEAS
jgi:hypothetical protein